jgi:hypothetical protein
MKRKKNQLIETFERVETLISIEYGDNNDEINKNLAELREQIDFALRHDNYKTIELNIHRGLEILHKLLDFL